MKKERISTRVHQKPALKNVFKRILIFGSGVTSLAIIFMAALEFANHPVIKAENSGPAEMRPVEEQIFTNDKALDAPVIRSENAPSPEIIFVQKAKNLTDSSTQKHE